MDGPQGYPHTWFQSSRLDFTFGFFCATIIKFPEEQ